MSDTEPSTQELEQAVLTAAREYGKAHLDEYEAAGDFHRFGGQETSRFWDEAREDLRHAERSLQKAALALHEDSEGGPR